MNYYYLNGFGCFIGKYLDYIYYLGLNQQQLEAKSRKSVNQQNHHPLNTEAVENIPPHTHTHKRQNFKACQQPLHAA